MALKTYVGARYAPQFMGAWDKSSEYAALSVVYTNDRSFVSRKTVPANTDILNTEYWIQSSDWNAQVAEYNELVQQYHDATEEYNKNVEAYNTAVSKFYADTLHSYRTKAEMVADASLKLEDTVLTCGDKAIGDTGGSFYRIVDKTSSKAVALENGLFAEPFEFQPYDYSEFATKTDEYKAQTDEQIQGYKESTDQQIENYKNSTDQSYAQFTAGINNTVTNFQNQVTQDVAQMRKVSMHNYDNVAQMKADTSLQADTTVLTSGQEQIGDNLGSFYRVQDGSSRSDAVTLNNGKKAVPFVVQGGLASGSQLNFLGQANVPNVWNVTAPNSVTVAATVANGGTSTVFVAVLYTSTSTQNVSITININSGNLRTVTVSDSAGSNGYKTVMYGISVRWDSRRYYYVATPITSWVQQFKADTLTVTQTYPASGLLPLNQTYRLADDIGKGTVQISVSQTIILKSITANFAGHYPWVHLFYGADASTQTENIFEYGGTDTANTITIPINKTLTARDKYWLECNGSSTASALSFPTYISSTGLSSTASSDGVAIKVSSEALGFMSFQLTFEIP